MAVTGPGNFPWSHWLSEKSKLPDHLIFKLKENLREVTFSCLEIAAFVEAEFNLIHINISIYRKIE